jgi:hypothetical protein
MSKHVGEWRGACVLMGLLIGLAASGCGADSKAPEIVPLARQQSALGGWVEPLSNPLWTKGFNVTNPDLSDWSSCFDTSMSNLTHAGFDMAKAAGSQVVAVGAGTVEYSSYANYPGYVVVIRHPLSSGEQAVIGLTEIFSMYGHIDVPWVSVGEQVAAGQVVGALLEQGSNSHLHWEMRSVLAPALCSYTIPGPGYTGPGTDARNWGFLDPRGAIAVLNNAVSGCDNGIPIGGTGCDTGDRYHEYVCIAQPGQQWEQRACASGSACWGDHCQGGCSCFSGISYWGEAIAASQTYCGMRVCGTDNQLYECQPGGWQGLGSYGCNCRCENGADRAGQAIDADHTYCGFVVCGTDLQKYQCTASGWQGMGVYCQ